ncbi:MAG: transcriptional repressor LexA [Alphaproteobacteria bacterium]|nr:transcriptional repressor LexA [Alphaproteobacteria bacterium]
MLTKKQHELLTFISQRLATTHVSPSFDEMKEALNLKSKSGIHRLIMALEERGFIRRLPHRARALAVIKNPDASLPPGARGVESADKVVQLPLYGRIAAGTPIEALSDRSTMLEMPASILGKGEHFCLEVQGDSMVEAGIHDGDTVLLEKTDAADTGSIVCALIDDQEATLKRLRRKGNSVALEAANPSYETRIFNPERVKIQGRLVGLFRRY